MAEIQTFISPLMDKVEKQGQRLRSLYSNGSGGPPGYLEMARAEDKKTMEDLFEKIDQVVESVAVLGARMNKTDEFILLHNDRDDQRDRRIKHFIALWSLVLAGVMALIAIYDHRGAILHSMEIVPVHSQLQQDSQIPPMRMK